MNDFQLKAIARKLANRYNATGIAKASGSEPCLYKAHLSDAGNGKAIVTVTEYDNHMRHETVMRLSL